MCIQWIIKWQIAHDDTTLSKKAPYFVKHVTNLLIQNGAVRLYAITVYDDMGRYLFRSTAMTLACFIGKSSKINRLQETASVPDLDALPRITAERLGLAVRPQPHVVTWPPEATSVWGGQRASGDGPGCPSPIETTTHAWRYCCMYLRGQCNLPQWLTKLNRDSELA